MKGLPGFMWIDANTVARDSYDAVMAGIPIYVPGKVNRTIATLAGVLPRRAVLGVMKRMSGSYRRT